MFFAAEEYDSDYNGELDFWEFRKVLRTPGMTKKLGFLGVGPDEAESLYLGSHGMEENRGLGVIKDLWLFAAYKGIMIILVFLECHI